MEGMEFHATNKGTAAPQQLKPELSDPIAAAVAARGEESHLDAIARSLKVPDLETKRARRPREEEASAAELLLGIGTHSDQESGGNDSSSAAAQIMEGNGGGGSLGANAADAGGGQHTNNSGGVRRSSRRGPGAGMNPAVAAALAAEEHSASDDEEDSEPTASRRTAVGKTRVTTTAAVAQVQAAAAAAAAQAAQAAAAVVAAPAPLSLLPPPAALLAPIGAAPAAVVGELNPVNPVANPVATVANTAPFSGTKSELTLLCERFQHQFGHLQADGSPAQLMLNDVAEALGVPRRRLYDVINVFESIEVMKRVGKLMYEFCGYDHLPTLLQQLAADEEAGVPVEERSRRAPAAAAANAGVAVAGEQEGQAAGNAPRAAGHSLWVLSRRLVRMLLKSGGPIALTAAAAELVGPQGVNDPSQHRSQTQITVERRLYDIGSILCSLGLVERVYIKKRQPAFEWVYGWRPGDAHAPPELPVAAMSRQPAPPLTIMPRPPQDAGPKTGRRGGRGGGGNSKRQRVDSMTHAMSNAMQMPGAMPFGFPPMMLGMPDGLDKTAMGAAMAQQYFSHPGFLSPLGMAAPGMVPGSEVGGGQPGIAAGSVAMGGQPGGEVGMEAAMAAAGMMMWPPQMAAGFMHPAAIMQMQQAAAAAQAIGMAEGVVKGEGASGGTSGGEGALGRGGEHDNQHAAATAAAVAAAGFPMQFGMPLMMGGMSMIQQQMVPMASGPDGAGFAMMTAAPDALAMDAETAAKAAAQQQQQQPQQ